ncbi:MAG: alpha/beta fold hydrolase [Betaproteobacteria bacterium]|nr:alpha/beta fold hydrolase [Betaproteobacteria bacterium]
MLARLLRLILIFELFSYVFVSVLLVKLEGWTLGGALLLMAGLALTWRVWLVVVSYIFACTHRSLLPASQRISFRRGLLEGMREVLAHTTLSLVMGLDRLIPARDAPGKPLSGQVPLLLIHGYQCNRGFWWWLKPRLAAHGSSVATLTLEPLYGGIDGYTGQVARRVEALCRESGAAQVILVGHSMGGLVCRAYLRRYGEQRVARLITLGTPHHGSLLARFALGRNAREMEPDSAWLKALAETESPLPVPCIAFYSPHDNYVMPQASAMLAGAENRPLPGLGHLAMSISPVVLAVLLEVTVA